MEVAGLIPGVFVTGKSHALESDRWGFSGQISRKTSLVWYGKIGGGMSNEPTGDVALVNGESHAKIANPMGQNVQQFLAMNHRILQGQSLLALVKPHSIGEFVMKNHLEMSLEYVYSSPIPRI